MIIAAAQEERFTRKRHDEAFPHQAIEYCLREGKISLDEVDYVAFYEKPFLKFERLLQTYLAFAPRGFASFIKAMPLWLKQKIWMKETIRQELKFEGKILFAEHHESHAASAFFASPFQEAAFLTIDGVGEWTTTSYGFGRGNSIEISNELHFPHSLGLLYSAFTYYTGFKVNSGEYKMMGLAPYGEPKYKDIILSNLIDLKADGSFRLNLEYFDYCTGLTMTSDKFHKLFGGLPRKPESQVTQRDMDLARSIQDVTEEVMVRMARHVRATTGLENLCLAGGVALNCVGNGKILADNCFKNIWIQPAAGDAGGALGAALHVWYHVLQNERVADGKNDFQQSSYLGPGYDRTTLDAFLKEKGIPYTEMSDIELPVKVADLIAEENVIGWFQGRMEFGPRALGSRSIIGDARSTKMQEIMNLKIKFRESFRPFAPIVLREKVSEYFEMDADSPYMLLVAPVREDKRVQPGNSATDLFGIDLLKLPRSTIPAVTHVDYSARIQTVSEHHNPLLHALVSQFDRKQNCPVIINTSYNVRGEPIVCTPEEAFRCFMRSDMDYLVLGNFILDKKAQKPLQEDTDWRNEFALD